MPLSDQIRNRSLQYLHPDPRNPRLPERLAGVTDDLELLVFISQHYDVLNLADSIATFGYFPSEPLVVVAADGSTDIEREDAELIVVEGNRRLAALKGLLDEGVRNHLRPPDRWDGLAARAAETGLTDSIPVIGATEWASAAPLIGFRHISGVEAWDSFNRARFIARLVDEEEQEFDRVASLVGVEPGDVRMMYRNFRIVEQARTELDISTTEAQELFGIFTAALNRRALREFIGAPSTGAVEAGARPVPPDRADELQELLSWIYGSHEEDPVIDESRNLMALARAVSSEPALQELRRSRDLELADEIAGGPGFRLSAYLRRAQRALEAAEEDIGLADAEARDLVADCLAIASRMSETLRSSTERNS